MSLITLSSAGQPDKELGILISPSFSDGFDNSWDAQAANESGIYVYYQGARYTTWASNEYSTNLPLGFYTCANTAYTLKFSGFSGSEYSIYDKVADQTIVVNGSTPNYDFTIDAADVNSAINDRFVINYVAPTYETSVTTNAYGWASFSYASDVEPLDGSLKVYKGAISDETLNLTEVDYVKAVQGVMIYGEPSTTYYFAVGNGTADFTGNDIKPSSAWASHTGTIYCLKGDALYQYTGTEMPANKAYIQIGGSSAPQRIRMVINGAQGIEDVEATVKAEKFVENGQIFIRRGEHVYDLQGQIVK